METRYGDPEPETLQQACCPGQSWGSVPPMAAPVVPEPSPSQHRISISICWLRNIHNIPPPRGLEIPEVAEPATANLRFGIGSFGHPHFCTRPCVHISKGRVCPSGTECAYCHFPHRKMSKPDNRLRQRLLDASDQELLATFLPFMIKKAAMEGLTPRVDRLIELLKSEMHSTHCEVIALGRFRPMKMSFMRLAWGLKFGL